MDQLVEGAYVGAAGVRNYLLYVATSQPGESPPLFVMLHGCDQDAADFAAGTRMNDLAEVCRGVVLYPQQCRWVNPFGCWNWHDTSHQSANHGEPSLIAGMTRQIVAEHNVDPARIYIAGMSAGGAMAVILGQQYPDLYAAVGVHSGVPSGVASDLVSALKAMSCGAVLAEGKSQRASTRNRRVVPTIVFHGDQDTVVHPSNGTAVHIQARRVRHRASRSVSAAPESNRSSQTHAAQGSDDRAVTRTSETRGGVPEAELWMVHGAGHAWTGGSAEGTYTDTVGPDASREMMRFFLQQRLASVAQRH